MGDFAHEVQVVALFKINCCHYRIKIDIKIQYKVNAFFFKNKILRKYRVKEMKNNGFKVLAQPLRREVKVVIKSGRVTAKM